MSANGWLPTEYQDEGGPPVRDTPDDWIVSLDDGAPALASGDFAAEDHDPGRALKDGEIVEFDQLTDHGGATLTVRENGTFSVDRRMPAAANCVRSDFENVTDSVENLVRAGGPGWDINPLEPGEHQLDYYHWSDRSIPFHFDAANRRFVRAGDAPDDA